MDISDVRRTEIDDIIMKNETSEKSDLFCYELIIPDILKHFSTIFISIIGLICIKKHCNNLFKIHHFL